MSYSILKNGLITTLLFLAMGVVAKDEIQKPGVKKGDLILEPFTDKESGVDLLRGSYEVWENRETMKGRKIKLHFVIAPALTENPEPDPIFFFSGGPGTGASDGAGFEAKAVPKEQRNRDMVFVDQRGTGLSNGLFCKFVGPEDRLQTYLGDMYEDSMVIACRKELEKRADLALYTSDLAIDDIHEIRAALGYDKINISGGSYGGRAVLVYLRRHEETVRTATLFMPSPTGHLMPSRFAQDAQAAMDAVIRDCEADGTCSKQFPNFRKNLQKVIAQLKSAPVTFEMMNRETKEKETVTLTYGPFTTALRSLLYSSYRALMIPALIEEAAKDNYEPITLYAVNYNKMINEFLAEGMYLSVSCAEDLPYVDVEKWSKAAEGTFLGDYRIARQSGACKLWPRGKIPEGYHKHVVSDVPTLIITGKNDPVTPPYWSTPIAKNLSNSLMVQVPNAGHGVGTGRKCVEPMVQQFLDTGSVKNLDTACISEVKRPPWALDLKEFMAQFNQ